MKKTSNAQRSTSNVGKSESQSIGERIAESFFQTSGAAITFQSYEEFKATKTDLAALINQEVAYLGEDLRLVVENADYLRASVGECHLMISRNSTEFHLRQDWNDTSLPYRFQKILCESRLLAKSK